MRVLDVFAGEFVTLTTASTTSTVIAPQAQPLFAGDFASDDFSQIYALDFQDNGLYSIDTTTGATNLIGNAGAPGTGQVWTGMAWDLTSSTMYAVGTDITVSSLHAINLTTGDATLVASVPTPGAINLAADPSDGQLYAVDIVNDTLVAIDSTTGAVTTRGPVGIDANFAQGMDFDDESGILYWGAIQWVGFKPHPDSKSPLKRTNSCCRKKRNSLCCSAFVFTS